MIRGMDGITLKAVARAGGTVKLGKALAITRQAVEQWAQVPPKHVLAVERLSGISRYELRPDIYGSAPSKKKVRDELRRQAAA